jgi:hypothetical protein
MPQIRTDFFAHYALKMMLVKPELAGTLQTPPGKRAAHIILLGC